MGKWVISWIDWFNYEMHFDIVWTESEDSATLMALRAMTGITKHEEWEDFLKGLDLTSVEKIKQEAFNCDGMVGAIRID